MTENLPLAFAGPDREASVLNRRLNYRYIHSKEDTCLKMGQKWGIFSNRGEKRISLTRFDKIEAERESFEIDLRFAVIPTTMIEIKHQSRLFESVS